MGVASGCVCVGNESRLDWADSQCCIKESASSTQESQPSADVPRSDSISRKWMLHAERGQMSRSVLKIKQGGFALRNFCPSNPCKLEDFFECDKQILGQGGYGSVRQGRDKRTGMHMAIKTITKDALTDSAMAARMDREIEIMQLLDHPNIIRFRESFADLKQIHLVLDLCEGGDLLQCISNSTVFNEHIACRCIRHMLLAVNYLHQNHICHRDIKPENWLLGSREDISQATLKLIDFGFSRRFNPEVKLKSRVGTPFYIAPEVISGCYDSKVDVWSLGVLSYLLLSGKLPFAGRTTTQTLNLVQSAPVKLAGQTWNKISQNAKGMIKSCLRRDEQKRPTAQQALRDTWVSSALTDRKNNAMSSLDVHNIKIYSDMHKVKKATLTVIATQLTESSIQQLKKMFMSMDKNHDGTLSMKEVRDGMNKAGVTIPAEFDTLIDAVDNDGSGAIDYTEFLAATIDRKLYHQKDVVWTAFKKFDLDGSGFIEKKELMHLLGNDDVQGVMHLDCKETKEDLEKLFRDIDVNGDGTIDFDEFFAMMVDSTREA